MDLITVTLLSFIVLQYPTSAQDENPGSLRLVGGNQQRIFQGQPYWGGRLEIFWMGQWGTVCAVGFEVSHAQLACNQLGYHFWNTTGTVGSFQGSFGQRYTYPEAPSSTPIWSRLECFSTSLSFNHCNLKRDTSVSCNHLQDVVIECSRPYETRSSTFRLVVKHGVTSSSLTAGRVEVFYVGQWGSVCNHGFSSSDAVALCHTLTGSSTVLAYGAIGNMSSGQYEPGPNTSPVWIQNLHCQYDSVKESYECSHDGIGVSYRCLHDQDIAISCLADGAIRLIPSSFTPSSSNPGSFAGRLEIYHSGQWGTVCEDLFSKRDADVVCQQLGYEGSLRYGNVGELGYTHGTGTVWLADIGCTHSDVFLANCTSSGFGGNSCAHSKDVAISCVTEGTVRLVPFHNINATVTDPDISEGRLEIYIDGEWGTVCDDGFDKTDARVACQQLGFLTFTRYTNVMETRSNGGFGAIWLTDVTCTASDTSLLQCTHSRDTNQACSHSEDVVLFCSNKLEPEGLPGSAIAGIVISVLIGSCCLVAFMLLVICLFRNRSGFLRTKQQHHQSARAIMSEFMYQTLQKPIPDGTIDDTTIPRTYI